MLRQQRQEHRHIKARPVASTYIHQVLGRHCHPKVGCITLVALTPCLVHDQTIGSQPPGMVLKVSTSRNRARGNPLHIRYPMAL